LLSISDTILIDFGDQQARGREGPDGHRFEHSLMAGL
jgi:hypothetical protein